MLVQTNALTVRLVTELSPKQTNIRSGGFFFYFLFLSFLYFGGRNLSGKKHFFVIYHVLWVCLLEVLGEVFLNGLFDMQAVGIDELVISFGLCGLVFFCLFGCLFGWFLGFCFSVYFIFLWGVWFCFDQSRSSSVNGA